MRNKIGAVCMVLGAVLVLSALSLFLWNRQESRAAETAAKNLLPKLMQEIGSPSAAPSGETEVYPDPYDPAMTEVEIDGYTFVGYLSIPVLELELPVMSRWDDDLLKISPCRYAGSTKTDDFVICAHNYDRHFGTIRNLTSGDELAFTDMDGLVWHYAVEEVEVLAPTDVEDVTAGEYDLTLFTCTYGGATRVAVRCERVAEPCRAS